MVRWNERPKKVLKMFQKRAHRSESKILSKIIFIKQNYTLSRKKVLVLESFWIYEEFSFKKVFVLKSFWIQEEFSFKRCSFWKSISIHQ